ncbi:MAG: M13 family metallopeptidase [Burkholderiales bacterium]
MVKFALTALLVGALTTAAAQPATSARAGVERNGMDTSVRPQDDLFRYANGRWLKTTPMPAERAYIGGLSDAHERTQGQLRLLIEQAAANRNTDADAARIDDLYASFMDEATLDKRGLKPLAAELAAIRAITDRQQLAATFGRLVRLGAGAPIGVAVGLDDRDSSRYVPTLWQGGLGLPNRDYYLQESDARFREARIRYVEYVSRLLTLADERDIEVNARAVLVLEAELAKVQASEVENRDPVRVYNRVELSHLPELAPALDWPAFAAATGLAGKTPDVIVGQPAYLRGLSQLLQTAPLAAWKAYAMVRLLDDYAPYLGREFSSARFVFRGMTLQGRTQEKPRWERGVTLVDDSLGEALGQRYVEKHFPPAARARIETMVSHLLEACRQSIAGSDWMSRPTQSEALSKLAKFRAKIGYPKRWIDYSAVKIDRSDLVGNVVRARAFDFERGLFKLGKPVDRDEWGITPQTVNAYYNATMNEIVFPAAILQPPSFDADADDAVNYGAIGAVIGHEISHGFDDGGSQYDGNGNLRDWWSKQDKARFAERTAALVEQYGAYSPLPGYKINGELTLGENIADNAGLGIAYKAWKLALGGKPAAVIDGLSGDARFFLGWAQQWRGKVRDQALLRQLKSDPHSPDEYRVNGAVRNHPAFGPAFGVKPGDPMYLAPEAQVSIW